MHAHVHAQIQSSKQQAYAYASILPGWYLLSMSSLPWNWIAFYLARRRRCHWQVPYIDARRAWVCVSKLHNSARGTRRAWLHGRLFQV